MRSIVVVLLLAARAVAAPCDTPGDLCECSKGDEFACLKTIHSCHPGDTVCTYIARSILAYDADLPLSRKACDDDFARACYRAGDFLKACLLGDAAGCALVNPVLLTPDEHKRVVDACTKNQDDSCVLLGPPLAKIEALCQAGHLFACARVASTFEQRHPDRATVLYQLACPRIDSACISEARLVMRTDEQKAIDILTPLCEKKVAGACVTLDEASHQR